MIVFYTYRVVWVAQVNTFVKTYSTVYLWYVHFTVCTFATIKKETRTMRKYCTLVNMYIEIVSKKCSKFSNFKMHQKYNELDWQRHGRMNRNTVSKCDKLLIMQSRWNFFAITIYFFFNLPWRSCIYTAKFTQ